MYKTSCLYFIFLSYNYKILNCKKFLLQNIIFIFIIISY